MHDIVLGIEPSAVRANTACYGHSGARGGESRAEWWALLSAFHPTRDRHSRCCNTQFCHGCGLSLMAQAGAMRPMVGWRGHWPVESGVWHTPAARGVQQSPQRCAAARCACHVSKTVQPQRFLPSLTLLPAPGKAGEWNDRCSWLRGRAHIFDRHYCAVESTIWSTLS